MPFIDNLFETATLNGSITDDGLPAGNALASQWTLLSGPAQVAFGALQSAVSPVQFTSAGKYVFRLSSTDGQFTTHAHTEIDVQSPVMNAGPDQTVTLGDAVNLNGAVTFHGQPAPGIPGYWSVAQQAGTVTFANRLVPVTTATFGAAGIYVLRLYSGPNQFTVFPTDPQDFVTITVLPPGAPPAPVVSISAPLDNAEITAPTAVVGSVSAGTWTLAYSVQDGATPQPFLTIGTGAGPVTGATFASFDPTLLRNGGYTLRLSATDSFGRTGSASINVDVTRAMKVGVFTISFNDVTVPLAGLPIQVVRTYDSRDADLQGDFGFGWNLSTSNVRLQKKGNLSLNWEQTVQISGFSTTYCVQATAAKTITISFPDGRVYRFQAGVSPACQGFVPITLPTLTFVQIPSGTGTAGATLTPLDGGAALWGASIPGPGNLLGYDGNPYNPTQFRLTTAEGFIYVLEQQAGLKSITDPNG
ncbi:MAG: PKD domain-containing protein, partial [Candidatus Acidiferrales bacterium]